MQTININTRGLITQAGTFLAGFWVVLAAQGLSAWDLAVAGKPSDRQVYIVDDRGTKTQVTRFGRWENILEIYAAPDKTELAVYHRPDHSAATQLTLYDLAGKNPVHTVEPGMRCDSLTWYRNVLLFKAGTSGGGTMYFIYDHTLNLVGTFGSYQIFFDFEAGTAIGAPTYGPDQGMFKVFRLTDGALVGTFDFTDQMDENYVCTGLTETGPRTYTIEVEGLETDQKRSFVTIRGDDTGPNSPEP